MLRVLIFIICNLVSSLSYSNEFGLAIVFQKSDGLNELEHEFVKSFISHYENNNAPYSEYYIWDGEDNIALLESEIVDQPYAGKYPITKAVLVNFAFEFYAPRVRTVPYFELIDLPTSEIIKSYRFIDNKWNLNSDCKVIPNPNETTDESEENRKYIRECYLGRAKSDGKIFAGLADFVRNIYDAPWELVDHAYNDKGRIETVSFTAPNSAKIKENEALYAYHKVEYEGMSFYDSAGRLYLKSTKHQSRVAKVDLLSRKNLEEAIDDDVIIVRDKSLIYSLNNQNVNFHNFIVEGKCKKCIKKIEKIVSSIPNLRLLKRGMDVPKTFFTSQYSKPEFLSYDIGDIQNRQLGAEYVLTLIKNGIQISEVETGKVIATGIANVYNYEIASYITPHVLNIIMQAVDVDLDVVKILEEKNGKINTFVGYHPFGFDKMRFFDLILLTEEVIDDRTLYSEEVIGKCFWNKRISPEISEFKVSSGSKAFAQALDNESKIVFRLSKNRLHEDISTVDK